MKSGRDETTPILSVSIYFHQIEMILRAVEMFSKINSLDNLVRMDFTLHGQQWEHFFLPFLMVFDSW